MLPRRDMILGLAALAGGAGTAQANVAQSADTWVVPREHLPREVGFRGDVGANQIHVLPDRRVLLWTLSDNRAIRYSVAIGAGDQYQAGVFHVGRKAEWPSWTPTRNMIRRFPDKYERFRDGVPGGPDNPLGARALYLYSGANHDSLLRIHGTPHPWTIGQAASNGCVRMVNDHVIALYDAVSVGVRVVLHAR